MLSTYLGVLTRENVRPHIFLHLVEYLSTKPSLRKGWLCAVVAREEFMKFFLSAESDTSRQRTFVRVRGIITDMQGVFVLDLPRIEHGRPLAHLDRVERSELVCAPYD